VLLAVARRDGGGRLEAGRPADPVGGVPAVSPSTTTIASSTGSPITPGPPMSTTVSTSSASSASHVGLGTPSVAVSSTGPSTLPAAYEAASASAKPAPVARWATSACSNVDVAISAAV
jgi:hypothetical protein